MTWLAWRQFRAQAWVALGAVAVAAVTFGITGMQLHELAATSGYPACMDVNGCRHFVDAVRGSTLYSFLYFAAMVLMYVAPALIGIFWGAPLVARELESGSFRLLWTQSISRTRWLLVKLLLTGAAAVVTMGLLSAIVTWWAAPVDAAGFNPGAYRFSPVVFGARGVGPMGYAVFALTLGVAIGLVLRRTLPAMAMTFAVFLALQIVVPLWVRPHLMAPVASTTAITTARFNIGVNGGDQMTITVENPPIGAWVIADEDVDPTGQVVALRTPDACLQPGLDACSAYVLPLHLSERLSYQPADRFWPFQEYETGIFLALSAILVGFTTWRVNRLG